MALGCAGEKGASVEAKILVYGYCIGYQKAPPLDPVTKKRKLNK